MLTLDLSPITPPPPLPHTHTHYHFSLLILYLIPLSPFTSLNHILFSSFNPLETISLSLAYYLSLSLSCSFLQIEPFGNNLSLFRLLSLSVSVCLSVCLYVCLSVGLSVYLSVCVSLSILLFSPVSMLWKQPLSYSPTLSLFPSLAPSLSVSVCLSLCLSICLYLTLSFNFVFYLAVSDSIYMPIPILHAYLSH